MNYVTIKKYDIANGIGVRVSLFVSGCNHRCKECFNSEAWDFNYGKKFDINVENEILHVLENPYIKGLSVLGGEPLQQDSTLLEFLKKVRNKFPNKSIWLYTGYTYEQIKNKKELDYVDVLVDGKFVEVLKDIGLQFRGSSNQRIIDVKATKDNDKIILCDEYMK